MICDTPTMHEIMMAAGGPGGVPAEIGHEDDLDVGVRCHWAVKTDEAKCANVFAGIHDAWVAQVDGIGFPPPQPDDDGLLDVYIDENYGSGAYTTCSSYGDAIAGDGFNGCPAYIVLGHNIPNTAIPDYLVHEFNHACQYAIDWKEWSLPLWEGVATAATLWTYPDLPPKSKDVGDYQKSAWMGILGDGYFLLDEYGLDSWFEYGSALWILQIDNTYGTGDGTVGGLDLWLGAAQDGGMGTTNSVTVMDSYDAITGGWEAALMEFDIDRTRVGDPTGPSWAKWATPLAQIPTVLETEYDALPTTLEPEVPPYATGVDYAVVSSVPKGETLQVDVETDDTESSWGILVKQGTNQGYTTGATSFQWVSTERDRPITVGVVDLEEDGYATTGDTDDLVAGQSTLSIALSIAPPTTDTGGTDTGTPVDDSGVITPDDSSPASSDDSGSNASGGGGGCGCASPGKTPPSWAWIASIALMALRRRR